MFRSKAFGSTHFGSVYFGARAAAAVTTTPAGRRNWQPGTRPRPQEDDFLRDDDEWMVMLT